jgi:hypothetical protein
LVKIEGKVSKEGPFDAVAAPSVRFTITNLGRVPGILRMLYTRCYLQREKFPERPVINGEAFRPAQNAIAAGMTGSDYPICEFEKSFSKQDWTDIIANRAIPVFTAILMYEGPLDYTYVDMVSYRIDLFEGNTYPLGIANYTNDQLSPGRISKGVGLTIPNIIWEPKEPTQPAK